jgi:hypothetical protein
MNIYSETRQCRKDSMPHPTYCKLHSLDSEAAFQLTVYVYYKKRLSSPKEHNTPLNNMVD